MEWRAERRKKQRLSASFTASAMPQRKQSKSSLTSSMHLSGLQTSSQAIPRTPRVLMLIHDMAINLCRCDTSCCREYAGNKKLRPVLVSCIKESGLDEFSEKTRSELVVRVATKVPPGFGPR